jgi:acetyl-CoA carboxylase carboxyltransferase component
VIPADPKQPFDVRAVLARLLDGSRFQEFKAQVAGCWVVQRITVLTACC